MPHERSGAAGECAAAPGPSTAPLTVGLVAQVTGAVAALQALAWILMYELFGVARIGYWFFTLSDLAYTYFNYARNLAAGMVPYRDFFIEYPPLFVTLLLAVGKAEHQWVWVGEFALLMVIFMIGAGSAASLAAAEPGDRWRPYKAAAVFAGLTLLLGPISANRYDASVAFVIAVALLLMVRGGWMGAGIALGLGFALKVTPAILLPVVFLLAPWRTSLGALAGFAVAAAAPFVWTLSAGGLAGQRLSEMFSYHLSRPLEFESVLTLPLWLPRFWGAAVPIGTAAGSQVMLSAAAGAAAKMSAVVLAAALGTVFLPIWRRRETITESPRHIALASLATMLASLVGSKVLSPQYFVWLLPAVAVVALDRKALAGVLAAAMLLTQVVFPALYMDLFERQALLPVGIIEIRNVLVLVAFGMAVRYLWKLPEATGLSARVR